MRGVRAWSFSTSLLRRRGALVGLLLIVALGTLRYEAFLTPENLLNVVRQNSMLGLVALGMTFVILTGGIDLSVGSLAAVAGVAAASVSRYGVLAGLAVGLLCSTVLGLTNGLLISKGRIPPFLTTLAVMMGARGVVLAWTGEQSVRINRASTGFHWLGRGHLGPIPVPILVLAVCFTAAWLSLAHTAFGRHVYSLGDSLQAARLMGLNTDRLRIAVYALSGLLAGLGGIILACRLGAAQPVAGTGWELDAIASVVIGGTRLTGGEGGVGLTIIGVLLFGIIFNLINLEGTISSWWQGVLRGAFLLVIVVLQSRFSRGQHSR
jgi:ribose/xylose/arabinose/galactoside ABC-type transport system permease subunit